MDTQITVQTTLRRLIDREGVRGLGKRLKIDAGYISRVVNGLQSPGPKMLAALGFERIDTYRRRR